jgi:hypothetical protein
MSVCLCAAAAAAACDLCGAMGDEGMKMCHLRTIKIERFRTHSHELGPFIFIGMLAFMCG